MALLMRRLHGEPASATRGLLSPAPVYGFAPRAMLARLGRRFVDQIAERLRLGGLLQDPDVGDVADLGPNCLANLLQH